MITLEDTLEDNLKDKYSYDLPRHEFDSPKTVGSPNVMGRLKARVSQWAKMGASDYILQTLETGYKLPLLDTPEPRLFKNNKSALRNGDFVETAINELLDTGRIIKLRTAPKVVNPLSVSENGDKKRLILDLRYVNQHLWKQHVKFEDFKTFKHFIKKGSYMFHFDFRSGYHHIDIFEEHQIYLGFSWTTKGVTSYYSFVVLPFGLSTAPYIFTKVCRVLVKHWRACGVKIAIFIDDGIGADGSRDKCKVASKFVRNSIELSGFVVNDEKSEWNPIQLAVWLGLEINTKVYALKITEKRVTKVLGKARQMSRKRFTSARQVSSIAGGIESQSIVLGSVTGLFTREMYRFIAQCPTWDRREVIPAGIYTELNFWQENLPVLNMRYLDERLVPVCASINSDASNLACGAIMKIDNSILETHKNFTGEEADQSSTWRELEAVSYAVQSFAPMLRGRAVNWETDNQAVPSITSKGSRKPHLQQLAVNIFNICRANAINLNIYWVPREQNTIADELSKFIDYDDWKTTKQFFTYLNQKWGPFTVDRFASHKNTQTARYNSLFWNPSCEAVDAFSQDWSRENNWVVPPIFLAATAIHHARACKATGTLIVPLWESAPFWPMLRGMDGGFKRFVIDFEVFTDPENLLELGDFRKSLLGSPRFKSPIIAIRFHF